MFSYRHAFHAGNHADVLKHLTLIAVLKHLTAKDAGLTVIDTHAGAGLYRLDGDMARISAEATQGVHKLLSMPPSLPHAAAPEQASDALDDYLHLLARFNTAASQGKVYPGSPLIMQHLLRPQIDKLKLFELHPSDYRSLLGHIKQLRTARMVSVDCANGFDQLRNLLPPPNKRALVLIDPSYELKSDYAQVSACIQEALQRFPTGCYAVWYPIIPRLEAHGLPKKLKTISTAAKRSVLNITLNIGQDAPKHAPGDKPKHLPGLRASGMFIINPPHRLRAALQEALPRVLAQLGRGRGKGFTLT